MREKQARWIRGDREPVGPPSIPQRLKEAVRDHRAGNLQQAEIIAKAAEELEEAIKEAGLQGDVMIEESSKGIIVRIADKLFFDRGEAALKAEALPVLSKLGNEPMLT